MHRLLPFALLLLLSACGSDPDKPASSRESDLAAKAVADVDAAMAEARRAPVLPTPVLPPPAAAATATLAEGEAAAAADGQ